MSTPVVKPTTPAAWEWYAGATEAWLPASAGSYTSSRTGPHCNTAFQKMPDYWISGVGLTVTQVKVKALAAQRCETLSLVVARCPKGKTPATINGTTERLVRVGTAVIATAFTDADGSVRTSPVLALSFTPDTVTYDYFWGCAAATLYAEASHVGIYRNNVATTGTVTSYLYFGDTWTEFPEDAGACDNTATNVELAMGVWFETTASHIQSIPSAACSSLKVYFVSRCLNGRPVIKLTGAKTAGTTPLTVRLFGMNAANTAYEAHLSASVTTNGASSEIKLGELSAEATNALPATADAADEWELIISERPDTTPHAAELFYTSDPCSWGQSDTDSIHRCHSVQAAASAYSFEPVLTAQDACYLRIQGGASSVHGTIEIGQPFVDIGNSQLSLLGPAINAAMSSPRVHIDASVPSRPLSFDSTDPVLTSIREAILNGIGLIEGAQVAIVAGYNDFAYPAHAGTDALCQGLLHRMAWSLEEIVSQLIGGGNDVILLTPFYDAQLAAGAQREEWVPEWCDLIVDIARRTRTTGLNLFDVVRPTSGIYLNGDGIHPSSDGANLLADMVAAEYNAGYTPDDTAASATSRFERF